MHIVNRRNVSTITREFTWLWLLRSTLTIFDSRFQIVCIFIDPKFKVKNTQQPHKHSKEKKKRKVKKNSSITKRTTNSRNGVVVYARVQFQFCNIVASFIDFVLEFCFAVFLCDWLCLFSDTVLYRSFCLWEHW